MVDLVIIIVQTSHSIWQVVVPIHMIIFLWGASINIYSIVGFEEVEDDDVRTSLGSTMDSLTELGKKAKVQSKARIVETFPHRCL